MEFEFEQRISTIILRWISIMLWCISIFNVDFVWAMDFNISFCVNFNIIAHGLCVYVDFVDFNI